MGCLSFLCMLFYIFAHMKEPNTESKLDAQRVILLTWVSKAYYKNLKEFKVPGKYAEAAKQIASDGDGFRFDGDTLSWD